MGIAFSAHFRRILILSAIVRALVLFSAWFLEPNGELLTDIDYRVYTDAAAIIAGGNSPYLKEVYRYTPFIAYALIPNLIWPVWGKIIFSVADLVCGILIYAMTSPVGFGPDITRNGDRKRTSSFLSCLWLLSPFTIAISSRGSWDSIHLIFVLLTFYNIQRGAAASAGVAYGIAVHLRIYPCIFIVPILRFIYFSGAKDSDSIMKWKITRQHIEFISFSAGAFIIMTTLAYYIGGFDFILSSFLYHLSRRDHRHNFSPLFYYQYIRSYSETVQLDYRGDFNRISGGLSRFIQASHSISHIGLVIIAGSRLKSQRFADLVNCCMIQTGIFVTFNKVITSQYFLWYMIYLPFYVQKRLNDEPKLNNLCTEKKNKTRHHNASKQLIGCNRPISHRSSITATKDIGCLLMVWVLGQVPWLQAARNLEVTGQGKFVDVYHGSLIFFACHVIFLVCIIISTTKGETRD